MRYINELKTALGNDIIDNGNCFRVISQRIYGSMQLSQDLIQYGGVWLQYFTNLEADAIERSGRGCGICFLLSRTRNVPGFSHESRILSFERPVLNDVKQEGLEADTGMKIVSHSKRYII